MLTDDYQSYETYAATIAAFNLPKTCIYSIRPGRGAGDVYGFNTDQKVEIGAALIDATRKLHHEGYATATIQLDEQRRLIFSGWWQTANLYERLTGNSLMSGMAGDPQKLTGTAKKHAGANWYDDSGPVKAPPQMRKH